MCGIAGFIGYSSDKSWSERIQDMIAAQSHRGPDDSGVEVVNKKDSMAVFGHCRLAVIDTSSSGHQPMLDEDSGCWITYNGELYNFRELREQLKALGYSFRTQTDTEVLLRAYAAWGKDCLNYFRGIFAFAIWDKSRQILFCARDHVGVKPLYYTILEKGSVLFASEVRGLLASDLVRRKINLQGLRTYMAYGSVQDPLTLVSGVISLLPGHSLTWKNGTVSISRYWQLPDAEMINPTAGAERFDEVCSLLESSVNYQKVSDVPLGTFLSGGIDSTAITALLQRVSRDPVKSFSIVFDEKEYDERAYSRLAAKYISTDHTELHLDCKMFSDGLSHALGSYDQPSMDGLNTYLISQMIKEAGLTVALSGLGGDELFGGYDGYGKTLKVQRWGQRIQLLPILFSRLISRMLDMIPQTEHVRKIHEVFENNVDPYFVSRQLFSSVQVKRLLAEDVLNASENWVPDRFTQLITSVENYDPVNRASALEMQTYMLSTLLRDTDQMSMAHALEVRVPFLDHKLIEYMFTVPGHYKVHTHRQKIMLTKALGNLIPEECISRPKMGFTLPFALWLKSSLQPLIEQTFGDKFHKDIFLLNGLSNIVKQFQDGYVSWSRLWSLFILCYWIKRHRITL